MFWKSGHRFTGNVLILILFQRGQVRLAIGRRRIDARSRRLERLERQARLERRVQFAW